MVKMHKLTKGGQTIYPATIYDAVVNPKTRKSLTSELSDLNKGSAISTQFNTDFSKTRLGIPKENRSTGKILSYRNGTTGDITVEMYMGTSMDDQYWSDDLFWCQLLPSTKFPFINITAITGNNYNTPDSARNALPNTYNKKIGLVFTYGEFYQFNLSSCIRQQNSLTAQFVSFSLSNLANIFYPPNFYNN